MPHVCKAGVRGSIPLVSTSKNGHWRVVRLETVPRTCHVVTCSPCARCVHVGSSRRRSRGRMGAVGRFQRLSSHGTMAVDRGRQTKWISCFAGFMVAADLVDELCLDVMPCPARRRSASVRGDGPSRSGEAWRRRGGRPHQPPLPGGDGRCACWSSTTPRLGGAAWPDRPGPPHRSAPATRRSPRRTRGAAASMASASSCGASGTPLNPGKLDTSTT
ncbi:MAG: hypothetical protein JWR58_1637 [Pseudonocardia sp.]|nr:hypothetical protein [Pseudonocardia sp.]